LKKDLSFFVIPDAAKRRSGTSVFGSAVPKLDRLAPSMALALCAACGVRVCNPANAVGFHPQAVGVVPE